jgi:hypothetical protein
VEQRHRAGLMEIGECILGAPLLRETGVLPTVPVGKLVAGVVRIEISQHPLARVGACRTRALSLSAYRWMIGTDKQ